MFRLIFTFSFLLVWYSSQANNFGDLPIKNFSNKEIGSNGANTIYQDAYGNIICGTQSGLYVFKANKWELYKSFSNPVTSINLDNNGRLHLGGPYYFGNYRTDSLGIESFVDVSSNLPDSLAFERTNKIVNHHSGIFYNIDDRIMLLNNEITEFGYDDVIFTTSYNGDLWIQRKNSGLFTYAGKDFKKINRSESIGNKEIVDIADLPKGKHLILFKNQAIDYDGNYFNPWPLPQIFRNEGINISAAVSSKEGVFIATSSHGIIHLDQNGKLIRRINTNHGLSSNRIISLYKDSYENIWATTSEGVSVIRTNTPIQLVNNINGNKELGKFLIKENNRLYLGTNRSLYSKSYSPSINTSFNTSNYSKVRNSEGDINQIQFIDRVCFMNSNKGFFAIVDNEAFKISPGKDIESYTILVMEENGVLLEAYENGLNLYKKVRGKWRFSNEVYGINESILDIKMDGDKRIWALGQQSGILKLNFNDVLNTIEPQVYSFDNATSNDFYGISLINENPIIYTSQGIYEYDVENDVFKISDVYAEAFGINNRIVKLYQDEAENIWFISQTEVGLLKIKDNGIEKKAEKIIVPELFPYVNLKEPFIYSPEQNNLFFSGREGFIYLDQSRINKPRSLLINLHKIQNFTSDGILNSELNEFQLTDNFDLKFIKENNRVKFLLNSNYINNEDLVYYQYNINSSEWSEWNSENSILLDLKNGNHTIAIRGKIGENEISNNTLEIPITIYQDWYKSQWGKILILILSGIIFGILLFGLFKFFSKRRKKRKSFIFNLKQELLEEKEKSRELTRKNEILSNQLLGNDKYTNLVDSLKKQIKEEENEDIKKAINKLLKKMNGSLKDFNENTKSLVAQDPEFISTIKESFPNLTKKDIKLSNFLRLDLSSKEIAPLLGITVRGVEISRYRLRKKLNLNNDTNLNEFLKNLKNV